MGQGLSILRRLAYGICYRGAEFMGYMDIYNSPMVDWKDKDIRLIDEAYIGVSTALVLLMVAGAAFIW